MDVFQECDTGISVQGEKISNLRFADDIDLIEETRDQLQQNVQLLSENAKKAGLKINIDKTKTMVFGQQNIDRELMVDNKQIENVQEFTYLGSILTWDNSSSKDIRTRIAKAKGIMAGFNNVWRSKAVRYKTKLSILRTCVLSVALYACETWTFKKDDRNKLLAFEMYCYRRILRLSWTERITNLVVRSRLNIREDIIQMIMRRKMTLFGHICRMNDKRKVKSVMLGIMDGTGRKGRPNREWLDDIRDWGQLDVHSLSIVAQNREGWRKLVKAALDTYGR